MHPEIPITMTLFISIAYAIKVVVEARARGKLLAANRSDELMQTLLLNDERRRRHSSLSWGIVLVCLAIGFALIQMLGFKEVTPGVIAVVLGATGVGNIASYGVTKALETRGE
jgi:hypothetical protein